MATEEKWEPFDSAQEEEEEALSLCDLPVNLIKEENESSANKEEQDDEAETQATDHETSQEDFNFGPWGGSVSTKSEMCAADDIFFQGQILPFRLSISSETGSNKLKQDNPSPCISTSESMDHNSASGFTSFSSRSSSRSSHYSSSTSCSSNTTRISNPRIHNRLHTHPSPKPQTRLSTSPTGNAGSNRNRNSSVWDFFRLGLVRTPEIELQDLKVRSSVSRNSSTSSSSNSIIPCTNDISKKDNSSSSKIDGKNTEKQRKRSLLEKGGGLLSGCSCSVSTAVKAVPLNILIMKSSNSSTENGNNNNNNNSNCDKSEKREETMQELKMKKRMVQKQKQQQQQQGGKHAISRHRTFEWIKELSQASYLDHEEEA